MFLSTATNNMDAKGRVSVPADFRAIAADPDFDGIIVWPSFDGDFLEGGGMSLLRDYQRSLERLDYYDEGRLALQSAIFAESRRLAFDSTGRVSMPRDLADHAGLNGKVMFVGQGRSFQIWNPLTRDKLRGDVRALARENRHKLRALPPIGGEV